MEKPKVLKGFLNKRGATGLSGFTKRWFVLENNKLAYYKTNTDTEAVQAFDLQHLRNINKHPEYYPSGAEDSSFSLDVEEGKSTNTYYLAASSVNEREAWIAAILASRKFYTNLLKNATATAKKAEETESVLSQELVEAKETVARLEAENAKLRAQLDEASAGGDGAANEVIALREEVESLKAQLKAAKASGGGGGGGGASEDELAQLREELEEERAQAKDYKQKLLELRAEHRKCAK